MANRQKYHQRGDWNKLIADLALGKNVVPDSVFHSDLWNMVFLLNFHDAGQYNGELYQWGVSKVPIQTYVEGELSPPSARIWAYKGEKELAVLDTSHGMYHITGTGESLAFAEGRWIRFKNTSHITYGEASCFDEVNHTSAWDSGEEYLPGDRKFYIPNGNIYKVINEAGTSACPITSTGEVHEDWVLHFAGLPNCYLYGTGETAVLRSKIHYDTWTKGTSYLEDVAPAGQIADENGDVISPPTRVSWAGKGWRAKRVVVNKNTPPPDSPDDWEEINNAWAVEFGKWKLVPDRGNHPSDYYKNFPGESLEHEKVVVDGVIEIEDDVQCHPSLYFPVQVDPTEQFEHIVDAYKYVDGVPDTKCGDNGQGQRRDRYAKGALNKVEFDGSHITDPDTLGAVFPANRWSWYESVGVAYFKCDGYGILADTDGQGWNGNQITNYGGAVKYNSPAGHGNWSTNPKITGALQNHIEAILSDNYFQLPATDTFKANWRRRWYDDWVSGTYSQGDIVYYGTYPDGILYRSLENSNEDEPPSAKWEVAEVDTIEGWNDLPDVCREEWGRNESGIEVFLEKLGKFDYMYQPGSVYQYVPDGICLYATKTEAGQNGGSPPFPSATTCLSGWDCYTDAAGNWRLTFERGCGRPIFMRSHEMGEPDNFKDVWTPGTLETGQTAGLYAEVPERWFGCRTNELPTIDYFCPAESFLTITPFQPEGDEWVEEYEYKASAVAYDGGVPYFAKNDIVDLYTSPSANLTEWNVYHIYSFTVPGNQTSNIKIGYMLHLFKGSESAAGISIDPDVMKSGYVMKIFYEAAVNKTHISVTCTVHTGTTNTGEYFETIGWNTNISIRHDPCHVEYWRNEDGTISHALKYRLDPQLLIDLYELLNFAIYKTIYPSYEVKYGHFHIPFEDVLMGEMENYVYQNPQAFVRAVAEVCWGRYTTDLEAVNEYDLPYWNDSIERETSISDVNTSVGIYSGGKYVYAAGNWQCIIAFVGCVPGMGCGVKLQAMALRVYFAENYLKSLPKKLLFPFIINSLPDNWTDYELPLYFGADWAFANQATLLPDGQAVSNVIRGGDETSIAKYKRAMVSATGDWHFIVPKIRTPSVRIISDPDDVPNTYWYDALAIMNMGLGDLSTGVIVALDYEDVPEDVFAPAFFHVDAPRVLELDNKPPIPDPPTSHIDPYAYLKFVLQFDLENPETITQWDAYSEYSADDRAWRNYNRKEVFVNLTGTNTTTDPMNDPTNWEWIPSHFELRIKGESCLCIDVEGSNPVKYKMLCDEDHDLDTGYSISRAADIQIGDNIELTPIALNSKTPVKLTGTQTKFYHDGNESAFTVDNYIEILGTVFIDGLWAVLDVGTDDGVAYFVIDMGWSMADWEANEQSGKIINYTKLYTETDWESEATNGYHFAFQAKDAAGTVRETQDNETKVGEYIEVLDIVDYPAAVIQDAI